MEIKRSGAEPSSKGPAEWFTGTVRIDPLFSPPEPAGLGAPSLLLNRARTAWHTHPLGQTLLVMSGLGWTQREGGPVEEIRPGDVVWFPQAKNIGTAPARQRPWAMLLSKKNSTAKTSSGWSMSAKSNIEDAR